MTIKMKYEFVRYPNCDEGEWRWHASWRNPLHPDSWDKGHYEQGLGSTPWMALSMLVKKVCREEEWA